MRAVVLLGFAASFLAREYWTLSKKAPNFSEMSLFKTSCWDQYSLAKFTAYYMYFSLRENTVRQQYSVSIYNSISTITK